MKVALYRGRSLVSLAIRFVTRSQYSHAAFLFDDSASRAAQRIYEDPTRRSMLGAMRYWLPGAVVEAWRKGVCNATSVSANHTPGTPVDVWEPVLAMADSQEENLVLFMADTIGWPYDFKNVLKFVTKRPGKPDGAYFCSELVFEGFQRVGSTLLRGVEAWEVPPGWLRMPTVLRRTMSLTTR